MGLLSWLRGRQSIAGAINATDGPNHRAPEFDGRVLRSHYEEVLHEEANKARTRRGDPYWSSGNVNVGDDELAAVDFAKAVFADPSAFTSLAALESALMTIRAKYLSVYPDSSGFGGATFFDIIRGVRARMGSNETDFPDEWNDNLDPSSEASSSAKQDADYEISEIVDDALLMARTLRDNNKHFLAFDFIQLHVIAIALQISRGHGSLSDSEILLIARQLKEAQSFAICLVVEGRFPQIMYKFVYRYITATSFLLTFIQEGSRNSDLYPPTKFKIPFTPIALDYSMAKVRSEPAEADSRVLEFEDGSEHFFGYRLANNLEELATSTDAEFLRGMFVDVLENAAPDWGGAMAIHYLRVALPLPENGTASFSPLQFDRHEILVCFALRMNAVDGGCVTLIALLDRYEDVVPLIIDAREAAVAGTYADQPGFSERTVELADALLNPLAREISDCPTLVVIAEGIISAVPFSGLPVRLSNGSERTFLVHTHRIINAISPRSLLKSSPSSSVVESRGVALFNPDFGAASDVDACLTAPIFVPLPDTEVEGSQLAGLYGWKKISGSEFTAQNLIASLSSYPIVHIASHGHCALSNSERDITLAKKYPSHFIALYEGAQIGSFIACAGANKQVDARVTCADLVGLKLENIDLAYLSLCLGAVGDAFGGETSFSLSRSIVSRGAKCVISSSLPVTDKEARNFALDYYSRLASGATATDSLRLTQIQFISDKKKWLDWAGYQIWI